jgi:hypothetical protein
MRYRRQCFILGLAGAMATGAPAAGPQAEDVIWVPLCSGGAAAGRLHPIDPDGDSSGPDPKACHAACMKKQEKERGRRGKAKAA